MSLGAYHREVYAAYSGDTIMCTRGVAEVSRRCHGGVTECHGGVASPRVVSPALAGCHGGVAEVSRGVAGCRGVSRGLCEANQ